MRQWVVSLILLGLAVMSLVMLKSIAPDLVFRQTLAFALGGIAVLVISRFSFDQVEKFAIPAYWGLVALLILVLVIGSQTRGTVGWFELPGGFKFQPSQFMTPVAALFLLTQVQLKTRYKSLKTAIPLFGLWLLPAILIGLEPDFGSMIVYLGGTGIVLSFYKIPKKWWVVLAGLGFLGFILAWFVVFKPYQRDRIMGFLNPSFTETTVQTETSAQYNARQAMIAVGSGTLMGRGLGYGIQSHLRFLPERQTDFIFASLSEELGFLGSLIVLGSYVGLISFLVWLAVAQEKPEKTAFLMSFAAWIFVQAAINLGMNVGLLPITGITLPFLSYGGSSILGLSLGLGVVQIISSETQKKLVLHIK